MMMMETRATHHKGSKIVAGMGTATKVYHHLEELIWKNSSRLLPPFGRTLAEANDALYKSNQDKIETAYLTGFVLLVRKEGT